VLFEGHDAAIAMASFGPDLLQWCIATVDGVLEKEWSPQFGSANEFRVPADGFRAHVEQPKDMRLAAALSQRVPHVDSRRD
jgi:hypothetical protein